jgi:hypothetical protein
MAEVVVLEFSGPGARIDDDSRPIDPAWKVAAWNTHVDGANRNASRP